MKAYRRMSFPSRIEREMNEALFARAQQASRLAKILTGRQRASLYAIKHRALQQLLCFADPRQVDFGSDADFYPGLLSVRVKGRGALHTHEGWLPDPASLGLREEPKGGELESERGRGGDRRRPHGGRGRRAPGKCVDRRFSRPARREGRSSPVTSSGDTK